MVNMVKIILDSPSNMPCDDPQADTGQLGEGELLQA